MTGILDHGLIGLLLKVYGVLFVLGPIVLRGTFRYKAKVNPQLVAQEALPEDVRQFMTARLPGITALGFQPVGYVSVGSLAPNRGFHGAFEQCPDLGVGRRERGESSHENARLY
jgi:hypothetical protein